MADSGQRAGSSEPRQHTSHEVDEVEDSDSVEELVPALSTRSARSILKAGESIADERMKRTVSWNDFQGKTLAAVKEFTPRWDNRLVRQFFHGAVDGLACSSVHQELLPFFARECCESGQHSSRHGCCNIVALAPAMLVSVETINAYSPDKNSEHSALLPHMQ